MLTAFTIGFLLEHQLREQINEVLIYSKILQVKGLLGSGTVNS